MKNLKTPIKNAKNLGSSHSGYHHWLHQRFTSIFMIPLAFINICNLGKLMSQDFSSAAETLSMPMTCVPLLIFVLIALYHGSLGMQVVIEDYIKCLPLRYSLIIIVKFFCTITVISAALALSSLLAL